MVTGLVTIYEALHQAPQTREFFEELHQTDAKEFWHRAIAVLQQFSMQRQLKGILLTHHPYIIPNAALRQTELQTWVFTTSKSSLFPTGTLPIGNTQVVSLPKSDALNQEWFCLLITETFGILVVSSTKSHSCLWSLHPQAIQTAITTLLTRIRRSEQQTALQAKLQQFPPIMPPYQIMARFGAILMAQSSIHQELPVPEIQEVDIIKAITHEVRTPLTTIRMLVRSLKRRKDVSAEVKTRLDRVDAECTEQIERFNLIFEAAQLDSYPIMLEATQIEEILSDGFMRWQEHAGRRQISLEMILPTEIPAISSNALLLSQVLNGLVDRLVRSFPPDSHIQLILTSAGEYLKLQFQSQVTSQSSGDLPLLKAVGQWLMLQPETGTLSLSLPTTKTLLKALGGKLTVRMHSSSAAYDGEILTIFLPFF
ncbi:MAG: HAMP domain-containing histidine kinase [Pseudanabaena sp. M158S2SP1A06QC]|nr:HAMP domain-containing histidine kinase [Pseudanabaena sp. M051S1SP1A06QC]MCA6589924.1 HAMP domain-containing histidine kinase [Pseudanabaena sp. M109S1SP1A06QC]MCA6603955.1 HAMP domain-containing histidine kinase [Pseudanabaena sp. M007S1SP1A06QC]MCA6612534.1 HAMP domain-containing histidine kinase [Pseudanabaena sp. M158S2SP1A06QC]MCA6615888.1 HAMP domain-containing histidine kinase [Pseudanabaena sp. M090S1SP1A06QC]MCA6622436.1 HAMP domain-containing histidine kinase [Pseudanabaena sp. M